MRRCCFWAPLVALSACATLDVTPFLKEQITGDTWRACLAREYQSQARFQARYGRHWSEASYLADLGRKALDGSETRHTNPVTSLEGKYTELAAMLGARGRTCNCATATARLDGWSVALAQEPARDQTAFAAAYDTARLECANQH